MTGPVWVRWLFAVVFGVLALASAARWVASRRGGRAGRAFDQASVTAHGLGAVGMAVMFVPVATPFPPLWWAAVFGAHSAWLARHGCGRRGAAGVPATPASQRSRLFTHVCSGLVMALMFAVMPRNGLSGSGLAHAGHLAAASPVFAAIGWAAAVYFLAHALRCGFRVVVDPVASPRIQPASSEASPGASSGAQSLAIAGHHAELPVRLVMGLGMFYMLLTML
jgi:hypothetical protein